jgi:CDGSH-type Zn-finger protein
MSQWPGLPCPLQLPAGDYAWCACGETRTAPFCDGNERCQPVRFTVRPRRNVETHWLCGCRRTRTAPFCDGSHNKKGR